MGVTSPALVYQVERLMANEPLHGKTHFEVELDSHCRRYQNLNLVIFEELLSTPPALPNGLTELPSKNEFRDQNLRVHDVVNYELYQTVQDLQIQIHHDWLILAMR
jgi:hypothetical protein